MKFLFFADTHLRHTTPACRKDENFYQVQFDKLSQIIQIANERDVDYILHGGDFFDSHNPPLNLIHDTIQALKTCKARWIFLVGNHDTFGETPETLQRSGLGILSASGVAEVISERTDRTFGSVFVRFIPRTQNLDLKTFTLPLLELRKTTVIIPHAMLTPKPLPFNHILLSDVGTNSEYVFCSDNHRSFQEKVGPTTFINVGATTRQSVTEYNNRPSVLYFDDANDSFEIIQLKFRPSGEVIDLGTDNEPDRKISEDFLATLRSTTFEASDRSALVREVGSKGNFDSDVVEETVKRVQEVGP